MGGGKPPARVAGRNSDGEGNPRVGGAGFASGVGDSGDDGAQFPPDFDGGESPRLVWRPATLMGKEIPVWVGLVLLPVLMTVVVMALA